VTEKAKEVVKIGNHIKGATAGVISFPFGGMDEKKEEKAEAKKEEKDMTIKKNDVIGATEGVVSFPF
jgi:hypothetical protein